MLSLWSWLLVALLGALLAEESEATGISGEEYKNVKVRPLEIELLNKVEGDWFVVAVYESKPIIFNKIQCLRYHYQVTEEPNVINVTIYERFVDQTRKQVDEKLIFEQPNNNVVIYINLKLDPALTTLLDYSMDAPSPMNNYLIYYSYVPGQDYIVFLALSREYCATPTPTVNAAVKQAKARVGLQEIETKNFYNEVCED